MIGRQRCAAGAVLAFVLLSAPAALRAQTGASPRPNEHWVTTWATAQQLAPTRLPFGRGEMVQPPPAASVAASSDGQARSVSAVAPTPSVIESPNVTTAPASAGASTSTLPSQRYAVVVASAFSAALPVVLPPVM